MSFSLVKVRAYGGLPPTRSTHRMLKTIPLFLSPWGIAFAPIFDYSGFREDPLIGVTGW